MASTFIALPLTSGEAFLLQTQERGREWAILVDSGKKYAEKRHELTQKIKTAAPNLSKIDIAICTHQDADHANGFKTFADVWCAGGGRIGEYWLPGRWAAAFPQVLTDPDRLIARIFQGAVEATEKLSVLADTREDTLLGIGDMDSEDISSFEQRLRLVSVGLRIADHFREVMVSDDSETVIWGADDDSQQKRESRLATSFGISSSDLNSLRIEIEETDRFLEHTIFSSVPRGRWWHHDLRHFYDPVAHATKMRLFNQALDTAKTIRAIAESALRWTIPIRWFDFGLFEDDGAPRGGLRGFLEPVCAVELKHPPPTVSNLSLFFSLRLSRQNVESLVFQRIETSEEPGVLFLGDSRFHLESIDPQKTFLCRPRRRGVGC